MSSKLYRLGRACALHARRTLLIWGIIVALFAVVTVFFGGQMRDKFEIPGSEGVRGVEILENRFPELAGMTADLVIGVPEGDQLVNHADEVQAVVDAVMEVTDVSYATNPLDPMTPAVSDNGRYGLVTVQVDAEIGAVKPETKTEFEAVGEVLPADSPLTLNFGGRIYDATSVHISVMEVLGVIVALIALAISFRAIVAAGLPIVTALIGVGIGMALILLTARFTDIITTTPTLALMIGLAVGIDYALFILHRHRAELARIEGRPTREQVVEAAARATATAGSAVVFAGVTVMIALTGLLVAGMPFLTLMGIAASVTVAVAVAVALTVLPALAGLLGPRLQPHGRGKELLTHTGSRTMGDWWVGILSRFPVVVIAVTMIVLVGLAIPAKDLQIALPDNGQANPGSGPRVTYDLIAEEFGAGANNPLIVIADIVRSTDPLGLMEDMGEELSAIPGVERLRIATPNRTADLGVVVLQPSTAQSDPATTDLVQRLRDRADGLAERYDVKNVMVTGHNAVAIDVSESLGRALLPFGFVVVGLSLFLLMLVFRSVWVPVKAALGYLLSVLAALGTTSMVFGYGWFHELFLVQKVGPVISFFPIILMGVLFGLAMDYEVFLVSRMREDYVHGGDARRAVRTGFAASARVVTTAAVIMIAVFAFFVPGADSIVKPIAFGLTIGVAIDAFLVRMTLVPAVMTLLGERAWWLPAWLDRRLPVLDVEGEGLAHHLEHREWTDIHGEAAVRAEDLTIRDRRGNVLADGLSFHVREGEPAILNISDDVARRAALAALTGRLVGDNRTVSGRLVVLGYMLPEEAGSVRSRSALVLPGRGSLDDVQGASLVAVDGPLTEAQAARVDELAAAGVTVVVGYPTPPEPAGVPSPTLARPSVAQEA